VAADNFLAGIQFFRRDLWMEGGVEKGKVRHLPLC